MEIETRVCRSTRTRRPKIRSRIFLEGNFFVDLQPGTPIAADARRGDTLPAGQTAGPVQLDQMLTALQTGHAPSLQRLVGARRRPHRQAAARADDATRTRAAGPDRGASR